MALADALGLVGTTIAEKYDVEAVVGEGASAIVYRALHKIWKRPVAVKVFRSLGDVSEDRREELLQKFVQEGQLLAELSERSAAIVQARDIGTLTTARGEWVPYMVLEWLDGETLEDVLHRERNQGLPPRSLADAMAFLEPVAEALALAHKRGVAHRDVKPGNIFVGGDPRGEVVTMKLLDFGIAKVVADAHKMAGAFAKTTGQVTSFTPAYGAPEQFSRRHGATGPWTDVFALALLVTELITGKPPLDGDDFGQLAVASAHPTERPTPRHLGATVSDEVEKAFAKALAVKPEERFAAAGDFWNALRSALHLEPMRSWTTTGDPARFASAAALASAMPPAAAVSGRASLVSVPESPAGANVSNTVPHPPQGMTSPPTTRGKVVALGFVAAVLVLGGGVVLARYAVRDDVNAAHLAMSAEAAPRVGAGSSRGAVSAPPAASAAPVKPCPEGMIAIPGGKFFMGSDDKNDLEFERPAHKVTIAPFCMDRYEVNVEDYRACSDAGECRRASQTNEWEGISAKERRAFDPLCNTRDPSVKGRHPVNCVDWSQAVEYCASKKARLPTEAEWEFAARGPDGRKYPWGDDDPSGTLLNACGKECVAWGKRNGIDETAMYGADDGWENTAPVGSFPKGASRYGVEDVVGNVWEWVGDWYAEYSADEQTDPKGPASGEARVIRGGAWNGAYAAWVRPTFRYRDVPTKRSYGIGFRCAMPQAGTAAPAASAPTP